MAICCHGSICCHGEPVRCDIGEGRGKGGREGVQLSLWERQTEYWSEKLGDDVEVLMTVIGS